MSNRDKKNENKEELEGKIFDSNLFGKVRVEEYSNSKNIIVYWFDYDIKTKVQTTQLRAGCRRLLGFSCLS